MTVVFETLRTDLRHIVEVFANGENFRTTGDCTVHHPSDASEA